MTSYVIDGGPIRETRYQGLGYRQDGARLWRVYDTACGRPAAVGAHYITKAELLADLDRYATEYGAALKGAALR